MPLPYARAVAMDLARERTRRDPMLDVLMLFLTMLSFVAFFALIAALEHV